MKNNTDFHLLFAQALLQPTIDSLPLMGPLSDGDQRRRFNVYRNNRAVSLIDNLQSSYPAINKLVGIEFFKAAARGFIDQHPPNGPVMAEYGREFGTYLSGLPNTGSLPYFEDIALLEWQWLQAYHCADVEVLQASALMEIPAGSIMDVRLLCHPSLSVITSQWPVGSIWTVCTQGADSGVSPANIDMKKGETVVITRPELQVLVNIVPESGAAFLDALQEGNTVGDSASSALEIDSTFDTGTHLAGLLSLGVFSDLSIHQMSDK